MLPHSILLDRHEDDKAAARAEEEKEEDEPCAPASHDPVHERLQHPCGRTLSCLTVMRTTRQRRERRRRRNRTNHAHPRRATLSTSACSTHAASSCRLARQLTKLKR